MVGTAIMALIICIEIIRVQFERTARLQVAGKATSRALSHGMMKRGAFSYQENSLRHENEGCQGGKGKLRHFLYPNFESTAVMVVKVGSSSAMAIYPCSSKLT
mmetsp:Transcript_95173/g.193609  ORF Transcript_95173/g.193609 Transcript_95173/m.193609 type:complete len:103 (+) Transcript_95173:937-1245(+)